MPKAWWTVLLLVGCTSTNEPKDTDSADTDDDSDVVDDDTDDNDDTDKIPLTGDVLSGVITDGTGTVLDAELRLCRGDLCKLARTEADGSYAFGDVGDQPASFEVIPEDHSYADAFAPLQFSGGDLTIDVAVPVLQHTHPLTTTAAEVELGTGLFVTVGSADLEPPLFVDPATEVAGVKVKTDDYLPFHGIDEAKVLGVWYLKPFDHQAANGLPFRIEGDLGAADGDSATAYVGSYTESAWVEVGPMTLSGTTWTADNTDGLPMLSTLVLVSD
jgi:hypothetical protein